ncbi:MAG: Lrp/AsnC family transcriptional regulator [Anaerolinea sp.]|nr:Lrp/AsnC family transcriptional regulator [Anaerolinea sp.]
MIDETDRRIVQLLQEDGRLSNAALAEAVGSTTSTVYERVKKLERKGVIQKYVAVIDPASVGKLITAFIRLTVSAGHGDDYMAAKAAMVALCQTETAVLECHGVAGEDCYVLKVRVHDPKELEALLDRLRSQVPIARSVTNIVMSTHKETLQVEPEEINK